MPLPGNLDHDPPGFAEARWNQLPPTTGCIIFVGYAVRTIDAVSTRQPNHNIFVASNDPQSKNSQSRNGNMPGVRCPRSTFMSMSESPGVLIFGGATRAACWSAARAGLTAVCFDLFADCDFPPGAVVHKIASMTDGNLLPVLEPFLRSYPAAALLPVGGGIPVRNSWQQRTGPRFSSVGDFPGQGSSIRLAFSGQSRIADASPAVARRTGIR